MDFSWLSSDRVNFAWLFSTIMETYRPEADIWWNDGYKAVYQDGYKAVVSSSVSTNDKIVLIK